MYKAEHNEEACHQLLLLFCERLIAMMLCYQSDSTAVCASDGGDGTSSFVGNFWKSRLRSSTMLCEGSDAFAKRFRCVFGGDGIAHGGSQQRGSGK